MIISPAGVQFLHCNVYKTGQSFKSLVWLPGSVVGCGKSKTYGGAIQAAFKDAGATLIKDLPFHYITDCAREAKAFVGAVFKTECHIVYFEA